MTARFNTRTGRTLVLTVGLSLAAVGCSSSSSSSAAPGAASSTTGSATDTTTTATTSMAATDTASSSGTSGNLSAETDTPLKGDCTAAKLGYPAIADFKGVKVGFSQSEPDNASFRAAETKSIKDEAAKQGATLLYADANSKADQQISDIKDLVNQGVQLLIVAPLNSDGLQPAWDAAAAKKIPVVTIDRLVNQTQCKDYITFIGSNFVEQGKRAADAMAKALNNKGNVVILLGSSGNGVTTDRTKGFVDEMAAVAPGVKISKQTTGNFDRTTGQTVAANMLQADPTITGIYAENDEMGVGAWQAAKAAGKTTGPGKAIQIVSIDGIADAVSKVADGTYTAVIQSNPRFGPLAFAALKAFEGTDGVPAKIIIKDRDYLDAASAKANLSFAF
jgi:galactofuranose transport system substrate-binding protein